MATQPAGTVTLVGIHSGELALETARSLNASLHILLILCIL
jgi:hypothetical protein